MITKIKKRGFRRSRGAEGRKKMKLTVLNTAARREVKTRRAMKNLNA
jgi:hypothetical protein